MLTAQDYYWRPPGLLCSRKHVQASLKKYNKADLRSVWTPSLRGGVHPDPRCNFECFSLFCHGGGLGNLCCRAGHDSFLICSDEYLTKVLYLIPLQLFFCPCKRRKRKGEPHKSPASSEQIQKGGKGFQMGDVQERWELGRQSNVLCQVNRK